MTHMKKTTIVIELDGQDVNKLDNGKDVELSKKFGDEEIAVILKKTFKTNVIKQED